jgi:hypothetical protein
MEMVFNDEVEEGLRENVAAEEAENDVRTMIELYGYVRAFARNEPPSPEHFRFAAGVICIILEPIKPHHFASEARAWRRTFSGISSTRQMQVLFVDSITPVSHEFAKPEDAIKVDFSILMRPLEYKYLPEIA